MSKKAVRMVNNYRVIYMPNHPRAMKSKNWNGYIYEHIMLAEKFMKRPLKKNEVVHHLDEDRTNNRTGNIIVLERSQHTKLHVWMSDGALGKKLPRKNRVNSKNSSKYCLYCKFSLQNKQTKYCSRKCLELHYGNLRPAKNVLRDLITTIPMTRIGLRYNVSDNCIRKWATRYNLDWKTLSQVRRTRRKGAETTGEVKSS